MNYVVGKALAASAITINGVASQRQGAYYSGMLNADNTSPLWQGVSVSNGTQSVSGNVYVPAANLAPQHDADGNLTNDGRWVYTWNGENRLVEMVPTAAALTAGMPYAKVKFKYDSQGRRILREKFNSSGASSAAKTTKYLYDGWNCIAELDSNNTVQRKYVWGSDLSGSIQGAGGVGGLLWVEDETNGEQHFYGYDGNGNVVMTADASTGAVSAEYSYSPFGKVIKATGSYAAKNRYRFSTKPIDAETGLYYYGYRYYDPVTGRWPSRDPIGERGGVNLYGFGPNSPLNGYDILGERWPTEEDDDRQRPPSREELQRRRARNSQPVFPSGWAVAIIDLTAWLTGNTPANTTYPAGSQESNLIKKSSIGAKLRQGYLDKFKDKKCSEWANYTNVGLSFGINEFIKSIPNGRAHFVGSADGDVYAIKIKGCKVKVKFVITNTTSLRSALYHIIPNDWNKTTIGLPAANWTQIYTWEEEFSCKP